jgi:thymidylate synthase ThyX
MNIGERAKITPEFRVNPIAEEVLNKCLALESEFENPPEIQLELLPHTPDGKFIDASSMGVTGAYQCYSPGQPEMKLRHDEKALAVAKSTLQSGHLTTRMFYDMTWRIIGISRSGTHDILHFHPFYNTNQQSQRYVEGKPGEYIIPAGLIKEQRDIFIKAADYANDSYRTLMQALEPEVRQRVNEMYPKKWQNASSTAERLEEKTKNLCQEIARYAMPIGQKTTLFYKINEVQLLRMFEQINNMPTEAKYVIAQMISKVVQQDPSILAELPEPLPVRKQEPIPRDLLIEEKQEFDSLFTTPTENSWVYPKVKCLTKKR